MSKAEERALKEYPYKEGYDVELPYPSTYDENKDQREAYIKGYNQAEKDLELTNEDVYDIWRIYNEVCAEGEINGFDETGQEVLKRFKETKKMDDLFNGEGYIEPKKPTKFCRTCAHRQPWECGQRTIQYCGIRKSNRTYNGLLKIKVTNPACMAYKEGKNYWEEIKERKEK